jgi:two-component system response regulator HydG
VCPLDLPPLRERLEDIPLLVDHFISRFNKQMGRRIRNVTTGVMETLEAYPWPGNVRELANAIEHGFVHCKGDSIRTSDLPERIRGSPAGVSVQNDSDLATTLECVEQEVIRKRLEACNWKRNMAAKLLGISVTTLWRKMEKYGISESHYIVE